MKSLFLLFLPFFSYSHPVIHQGGLSAMSTHQAGYSHIETSYTFHPKAAVAFHYVQTEDEKIREKRYYGGTNFLLKRWNTQNFQSNIYLKLGAGILDKKESDEFSLFSTFMFDIENRSYYFALSGSEFYEDESQSDTYRTSMRMGIAPYHGTFSEVQNWFILQANYHEINQKIVLSPMMRFFYKNTLWEIGYSLEGNPWLMLMAHF